MAEKIPPPIPPPPTNYQRGIHSDNLTNFRNFYDEAYLYSDMGLTCDVQGEAEQAVALYNKATMCIENALTLSTSISHNDENEKNNIQQMTKKMIKSKEEIFNRKQFLINTDSNAAYAASNPPPSYEETMSPTSELTFDLAASDLNESITETILFCISDGVQLFFIDSNGSVSAPSYPSSLSIVCKNNHRTDTIEHSSGYNAYLKISNWTYPLISGRSPILRSEFGSYIFPNFLSNDAASSVGVIIPDTVSEEDRELLEDLFANFTDFRRTTSDGSFEPVTSNSHSQRKEKDVVSTQDNRVIVIEDDDRPTSDKPTSEVVAEGLCTGAEWVAKGLTKGAVQTSHMLKKGSEKVCTYIDSAEEPTEVDSTTKKALHHTRNAAGIAVTVSSFIVGSIGKATMAIGRELAPHIRKHGVKILPKALKTENKDGRTTLDDIAAVAAGGLQGFGTIYSGLENSAKILATGVANGTVEIVRHKYGEDVGQATEDGLYAAGGIAYSAYYASSLGVKSLAKRAAKDAAIATVHDQHENAKENKKQRRSDEEDD